MIERIVHAVERHGVEYARRSSMERGHSSFGAYWS